MAPRGARQKTRTPNASKATRAELSPQDRLTPDQLKEILCKALIGPKGRQKSKLPSSDAINNLARVLNVWRNQYYVSQEGRKRNALVAEAEKALEALDRLVPKILEFRLAESNSDPFAKMHAAATERIKASLLDGQTRAKFLHREQIYNDVQGWKWLMPVLPDDFKNAMLTTNPSFRVGFNQTGPLARYIAAVIPLVTGDYPKIESIAGVFKSQKKKLS